MWQISHKITDFSVVLPYMTHDLLRSSYPFEAMMHGKPLILRRRTKSESTWGNEAGTSNHHISSYIIIYHHRSSMCTNEKSNGHTHIHRDRIHWIIHTHTHTETPTRSGLNPSGAAFILDNHASRGFLFIRADTLQILARQRIGFWDMLLHEPSLPYPRGYEPQSLVCWQNPASYYS